jgi:RNA polymerase sigma factor (sigma-70 family)
MANSPRFLQHLHRLVLDQGDPSPDGALLERYLALREEAAFETLVRRHGPMVWRVCRRVLQNDADAEDAFQTTFLVLVRRADSIRPRDQVGPWLHGVAYRTSMKARTLKARRWAKELGARPAVWAEPAELYDDLLPLLDEELTRLPDKYRLPMVLCDLEGLTRKEAACQLGWPEGTVATRLTRARSLLAERLTRRGCGIAASAIVSVLAATAASAAPPALFTSTIQAASLTAAGQAAVPAVVSPPVAALMEGVLRSMKLTALKEGILRVALCALLATTLGLIAYRAAGGEPEEKPATSPPSVTLPARTEPKHEALHGLLPGGPPPTQILASLDKDGRLLITTVAHAYVPMETRLPQGQKVTTYKLVSVRRSESFALDDIGVQNAAGKKIDKKDLAKLLDGEKPALMVSGAKEADPLHLRLIKDDTLVFFLPALTTPHAPPPAIPPLVPVVEVPPPMAPPGRNFPLSLPPSNPSPSIAAPPPPPRDTADAPKNEELARDDRIEMDTRDIKFPINFHPDRRGEIRELELHVSRDKGKCWELCSRVGPDKNWLEFRAPADGEYWFALVIIDKDGKKEPPDVAKGRPAMKVVVKTKDTKPKAPKQ